MHRHLSGSFRSRLTDSPSILRPKICEKRHDGGAHSVLDAINDLRQQFYDGVLSRLTRPAHPPRELRRDDLKITAWPLLRNGSMVHCALWLSR